jgi:hypothetical protein
MVGPGDPEAAAVPPWTAWRPARGASARIAMSSVTAVKPCMSVFLHDPTNGARIATVIPRRATRGR